MMDAWKTLVNVNKGQDAYSVIGEYILNHVTAIEDMIAVIQINGVIIKELYMVDMDADGYFYWESDWWECEEDVALLDFFPVSEAERIKWIPCSERLPEEDVEVLISYRYKEGEGDTSHTDIDVTTYGQMYFGGNKVGNYKHWRAPFEYFESNYEVIAWMPLPKPYKEDT